MPDVFPEESGNEDSAVLGKSSIKRSEIYKITFLGKLSNVPADAWDVSARRDETVLAWTVPVNDGGYHLYIGEDGGVRAPQTCKDLFSGYSQVTEINFNGCFDTSRTTDMSYMFDSCFELKRIDADCLDTGHVADMRYMFHECGSLEKLDISKFDTGQVTKMGGMFWGCRNLRQLDVSGFDMNQVTDKKWMFDGCEKLK